MKLHQKSKIKTLFLWLLLLFVTAIFLIPLWQIKGTAVAASGDVIFDWVNFSGIQVTGSKLSGVGVMSEKSTSGGNTYFEGTINFTKAKDCPLEIVIPSSNITSTKGGSAKMVLVTPNSGEGCPVVVESIWGTRAVPLPGITNGSGVTISIGNTNLLPATPQGPGNGNSCTANNCNDHPTCESTGSSLSWVMCPIINGIADGADALFNGLIVPMLVTNPLPTNSNTSFFQVWSSFRDIANVLLIVFLLIAIYAQAVGGGLIDAYTARKILPRLLVAAILINLSIYLVAVANDITNIVGKSIAQLIFLPFNATNHFSFSISGVTSFGGLAAIVGSAGAIWVIGAGPILGFLLLFIVLPALLAIIGVFVTLTIRLGLIIFLVVISPIAFALYCLPNTEQYFKKWWNLLFKTLMVYPIVMTVFAVATVLPAVFQSFNIGGAPLLTDIIQIVSLFLPLFLIPFAFKLSGGAVGTLSSTLAGWSKRGSEAIKGNPNNPLSLRNKAKRGVSNAVIARGTDFQSYLRRKSKEGPNGFNPTTFRGRAARRAATATMWALPDLDKYRKDQNELFDREVQGKVAIGADNLERAFFAKQWTGPDRNIYDADGNLAQTLRSGRWYSVYRGSDGKFAEHSAGDVARAHRSYDGNESKIQTLMKYEQGKVNNDADYYGVDREGNTIYDPEQVGNYDPQRQPLGSYMSNLPTTLKNAGLSFDSAAGAVTGANFAMQNQRKEGKHTKLDPDTRNNPIWGFKQDKHAYVQDFAENMPSYSAATGKTSPINRLRTIHAELQQEVNTGRALTPVEERSWQDMGRIAEGLDTRLQRGEFAPTGEEGTLQPGGAGGTSGGPGRVNESIQAFIQEVKSDPRRAPAPRPVAPTPPTSPDWREPGGYL